MTDAAALDPDELALLEEQRDHLLRSLDDLEREYAAGDLDEVDYLQLRDDYTVRAADVLSAIEEHRMLRETEARPTNRLRAVLVTLAVLVFAAGAGVFVAQQAGQRGDGTITGAIGGLRAELATCQSTSLRDPEAGVECYDAILANAPDNVEALTYQGWALIRAGRISEGAANLERAVEVDPDYADARVFRAIVAARGRDFERAAAEIDRFYRNGPNPAAVSVLQSQGLEREVFIELLEPATRRCWVDAAGAGESAAAAAEFLTSLGACLDGVIDQRPDSTDALVSRTYALLAGGGDLAAGAALAELAVAADPSNGNARLIRASIAAAQERFEDARTDLRVLEDVARPTMSFLIGGPEEVRATVDAAAPTTTVTTVAPDPDTTRPRIPNPDGG